MRLNVCVFLALLLLLSGCTTLAPDYLQPKPPVATHWPDSGNEAAEERAAAEIPWQEFFVDPQLKQLIELALVNNRDLRMAALNLERAQAQYRIQRAELLPRVDASAASKAQRLPADLSGTGRATTSHQYSVGLGVSAYELDLFGRVRSLKERALEQYLATEQARRALQGTLVAQVAQGYLTLAADRERLRLAGETLVSQQESNRLVQSRFDAGVASALDLHQSRTSVAAAQADSARLASLVARDQNALELLVGAPLPAALLPETLGQAVSALGPIAPGLPSEVLLKRPEVLQAEADLKGANANIGAARANFFPRIILIGSAGTASRELSGLFGDHSQAWSFTPQITLPLFDAGSNRAQLEVAKVDRELAVARYEKTIQSAFRDVADALARQASIGEQLQAQEALAAETEASHRLSKARYERGIDSYLNVLDAQRSLYGAQQDLIGVRLARLISQVDLYKALGGGSLQE